MLNMPSRKCKLCLINMYRFKTHKLNTLALDLIRPSACASMIISQFYFTKFITGRIFLLKKKKHIFERNCQR